MTTGVVLMAYGTPRTPDEIEPYYTDIRRGRPPTPEQLADLTRRYDAIGGISPLAALTAAQGNVLQAALDERQPGQFVVALGLKHAAPKVEEGVAALAADGVERIVGVVLAPHFSTMSIGEYLGRAAAAAAAAGLPFVGVDSWATEPAYVDFLAPPSPRGWPSCRRATRVVFTAHSLPRRILDIGDPYPDQLRSTAVAVAGRLGLVEGRQWSLGWQSAGRTPEPWITPDVLEIVDTLAADPDVDGMLVCPCGFVADHLEVLYDLDIEARARADGRRAGLRPYRFDERRPGGARRTGRPRPRPVTGRVLVVGAGITGLTVAHHLAGLLPDATIEVREADRRLGGKLLTTPFAGLPAVDEGGDAFLARVPHATALAHAVGLGDELTSPTSATAAVWYAGLHAIPEGLLLGVPADMVRLARSDLLTWRGKARAALEPLLPRSASGDSIGTLVRARFGAEVQERLVDALVGSIYAADTDRFSLAMVPQLAALAGRGRSLLLSARAIRAAAPPATGPVFYAPRRGMGSLVAAVATAATSPRRDPDDGITGHRRRRRRPPVARRRRRVRRRRAGHTGRGDRAAPRREHAGDVATAGDDGPRRRRAGHAGRAGLARAAARPQRLPRAQAGAGTRHGRVLRLAEVGPLAGRRGRGAARLARSRRTRRRRPRRRGGPRPCRGRGQPSHRHRPPTDRRAGLTLAGRLPAVPPPAPRLAAHASKRRGRRGSSSPEPATTASASRPASTRRSARRLPWRPASPPVRDDPALPDCRHASRRPLHRRGGGHPRGHRLQRWRRRCEPADALHGDDRCAAGRGDGGADPVHLVAVVDLGAPDVDAARRPTTTTPTTATPTVPPTTVAAPLPTPAPPPLEDGTPDTRLQLGTIEIPAIGLTADMWEGIRLSTLNNGPGHWPGTAMPGQAGNVVVAGHRVSHHADFRRVDRLVPGDDVVMTTADGRFDYQVVSTEVVQPDALWIVDQTPDSTATLFACHPPGSVSERIVVHLKLVA